LYPINKKASLYQLIKRLYMYPEWDLNPHSIAATGV
jgi:hypothetical protein